MALINCSECGNEVSEKAEACPKCGNPIAAATRSATPSGKPKKQISPLRKTLGILALFVVVIAGIASINSHDNQTPADSANATPSAQNQAQNASPAEPAAPPPAAIKISADDLFDAYKANEVSADAQYKGKNLAVSGVVSEIGKDFMENPYVKLSVAANQFEGVQATFSKERNDELAKLQKGESITVTCFGNGMVVGTPMLDCKQH